MPTGKIRLLLGELSDSPDQQDELARRSFEKQRIRYLEEEVNELTDLRELRKTYAGRVYWFLVIWCLLLLTILMFQGFSLWGFSLSQATMVALVGGTTISAIGLVGFIVRGLFGSALRLPQSWRREK